MKTFEEARRRWEILSGYGQNTNDLRQAVKSEEQGNPCDDGLRSVCWKAFLLCENLERPAWSRRISDSRSAYTSLRDHFLKYIEHPDDLESTVDPLAEDEESPWQALRRDETTRAEIYQDVERCLQENFFFREPSTKSMMLDILFIYSKLNPDLGYRQGMHEVLAPIIWVVERDAIERTSQDTFGAAVPEDDLMLQLLDAGFVEHDSFSLFCSVMQVARSYYEHTEHKNVNGQTDVAPIVGRCQYIHQDILMAADHEVATHLNTIEILPQIFLTRWIRLLFGREFPFEDVLRIWDIVFADGMRLELIDHVCVAMLLRIRWQLLEADYSSALTLLLRYPSPHPHGPQSLVQDGLYLEQNLSPARGAFLISKYSGRPPELANVPLHQRARNLPGKKDQLRSHPRNLSEESSPGRSPGRGNQGSLEALFQDVSEGLQRRTETWGVAKAVRGAVTEAKRNMAHSEPGGIPALHPWSSSPRIGGPTPGLAKNSDPIDLVRKAALLEKRDRSLVDILGDALKALVVVKDNAEALDSNATEALNRAYERVQSAQTNLQSSAGKIIETTKEKEPIQNHSEPNLAIVEKLDHKQDVEVTSAVSSKSVEPDSDPNPPSTSPASESGIIAPSKTHNATSISGTTRIATVRPSLAASEFSWMLGDHTHRSSFVSSASPPPDQNRQSESRTGPTPLFGDGRDESRKRSTDQDDGLDLSNFQSGRS